ncbi:MAG TPA: ATP-binding cassette domain-containing protein [Cyclobacteriaceae bacterium]|nr:ATP-binding cassette domain-containing protein [Cyclobacteriaceae bacterium]
MNTRHITDILRESTLQLGLELDSEALRMVESNMRQYSGDEFFEFKRDLLEAGSKVQLLFLEYELNENAFTSLLQKEEGQILFFEQHDGKWVPVMQSRLKGILAQKRFEDANDQHPKKETAINHLLRNEKGEIIFFLISPYKSLISEYSFGDELPKEKLTPVRRFLRLLATEKKEILYILFYAFIIGLISLILPLGIQTTVELISGGVFFSSVYVLIGIVIAGIIFGGVLQVIQISLVEHLQRRIFTKAAIEFAFRIPRIKAEAVLKSYAPELVNRFFDILTIQKGLPKLFIDLSSGVIQIMVGLLLLSLYHPFFVFFSLVLVSFLILIFYLTGPGGLESSINESKYKYKVAQWLEELARALYSFKVAGTTDLPVKRTDYTVNNYLAYRKKHFSVLVTQYSFILFFKAVVTGALLIMGTILVVNREITLGQFVAAEVIIILILGAVEKIIMYIDVIYDLFTAVDKIAQVTDLPLEKVGGIDLPRSARESDGYKVEIRNLSYRYPGQSKYALENISFNINNGEKICISGPSESGKTTLTNILAGLYPSYEGAVTIAGYSIRDLDLTHLRDHLAKSISTEDIFDGTILENITVGKATECIEDAVNALRKVEAYDKVVTLPDGLNTHIASGGKGLSESFSKKIILARCLAKNPRLMILIDPFAGLTQKEKVQLINPVICPGKKWTLVAISNDPLVMASCDRIILLNNGKVGDVGSFSELVASGKLADYLN